MINSQDIKKGTCIRLDGKLYFCVDFLHVKPGKGNTIMRTTLKDVVKGGQIERRFNIGEKLEDVRVERRPYQYTYQEGEHYHFMNQETFDDIIIDKNLINGVDFMIEGKIVEVQYFIHSDGAAERIGTCVADTEQVKSSLKFSVFSFTAVKSEKCDICQTT